MSVTELEIPLVNKVKPTPAQLVKRARDMAKLLRENDARAEELRQVPSEVMDACIEAGFFKICQPALYGGYEYPPMVLYDVVFEIGRSSAAIGWVTSLIAAHNWEIALCDPRVAEDLWRENPDARLSSSYAPFGKAEKVEGGYIVNGRWPWSSGSDHCQWAILGTRHVNPESPIGFDEKAMIIPREDYEVDQNSWYMAGMSGSGSKDIVVTDAFVPEYRLHNITGDFFKPETPGAAVFKADTYKYPFGLVFGWALAAAIVAGAQGAVDVYTEYLKTKIHAYTGDAMKDNQFNQRRLGQAAAMVYAARVVLAHDFSEMQAVIDQNAKIPLDRRVTYKWNLSYHARSCADAVAILMDAAGGSGFALSNRLQRCYRDIQTAKNHAFLNSDKSGSLYGWHLFTGEIRDFPM